MRRAAVLAAAAVLGLATSSPALAAEPDDVADIVADDGVYVEPGSSATADEISDLVTTLRNEGEAASVIVLSGEPSGGAVTFADAVVDDLGEDNLVLVVAPESYGIAGESSRFSEDEVAAALDAAGAGDSDVDLVRRFVSELVGADVVPAPAGPGATDPDPTDSTTDSGGGGISWLPVILIGGLLLVAWLWWRGRNRAAAGPRIDPDLVDAKAAVQEQIDAVANDIIDLEDEVRASGNAEATAAYRAAGNTYNEVTEAYAGVTTAQGLLDLSNRLDEAIWQLDSAEAILDGKPVPARPQAQVLPEKVPAPDVADEGAGEGGSLPPRPDYADGPPPRPEYERRDSRRSSYGGGGLLQILIGLGGMLMSRRGGGGSSGGGLGDLLGGLGGGSSRGGGLGDLFGGGGRGGATVRPPAPTYPRIDLQKPSASRPRSNGGTRMRIGRRRRRG